MPIRQAGGELCAREETVQLALLEAAARASDSPLPTTKPLGTPRGFSLPRADRYFEPIPFHTEQESVQQASFFTDHPAVSVIGDFLPSLDAEMVRFEEMQEIEMLGELMRKARISKLTGCIMNTELWRNHNGYAKVKSEVASGLGLGSWREIHRLARFMYDAAVSNELPAEEDLAQRVDHICRNPSCFNPAHTRLMSDRENNILKDQARKLEPAVISGQLVYMGDLLATLPWLEHTVMSEDDHLPTNVITTRLGPFALRLVHPEAFVVYGQRLNCDVFDNLRPFGVSNYFPPSRAKTFEPIENHGILLPDHEYKIDKRPTQKEQYELAIAA